MATTVPKNRTTSTLLFQHCIAFLNVLLFAFHISYILIAKTDRSESWHLTFSDPNKPMVTPTTVPIRQAQEPAAISKRERKQNVYMSCQDLSCSDEEEDEEQDSSDEDA
jgi:hypothetical protein